MRDTGNLRKWPGLKGPAYDLAILLISFRIAPLCGPGHTGETPAATATCLRHRTITTRVDVDARRSCAEPRDPTRRERRPGNSRRYPKCARSRSRPIRRPGNPIQLSSQLPPAPRDAATSKTVGQAIDNAVDRNRRYAAWTHRTRCAINEFMYRRIILLPFLLSACGTDPAALGITGPARLASPPDPGETQTGIPGAPLSGTQLAPSLGPNTGAGKFWGYN
jgi:hypothetical protein